MRAACDCYYENYRENIDLYIICDKCNIEHEEVLKIITTLDALGYLKYIPSRKLMGSDKMTHDFLSLTDSGKCYFERKSDEKWEFFRKSIITPIFVSFITTSITVITNSETEWLLKMIELIKSLFCS